MYLMFRQFTLEPALFTPRTMLFVFPGCVAPFTAARNNNIPPAI